MNSKVKTILGILILAILIAGAYFAYNRLGAENQPDIAIPDTGGADSTDSGQSNAPGSAESKAEKTEESGNNTGEKESYSENGGNPDENENQQAADETGQKEPEKLKAFDFTIYNAEGEQVKLSDFFGKPIIVNFWATWCPYCVREMPLFEESFNKYRDEIHFLMVQSVDGQNETKEKGEKFINENGYTFPVYFDLDFDATYTYQAYSMPTTVFIDKDGYLKAYHPGMLTEELLQKGIELILE